MIIAFIAFTAFHISRQNKPIKKTLSGLEKRECALRNAQGHFGAFIIVFPLLLFLFNKFLVLSGHIDMGNDIKVSDETILHLVEPNKRILRNYRIHGKQKSFAEAR